MAEKPPNLFCCVAMVDAEILIYLHLMGFTDGTHPALNLKQPIIFLASQSEVSKEITVSGSLFYVLFIILIPLLRSFIGSLLILPIPCLPLLRETFPTPPCTAVERLFMPIERIQRLPDIAFLANLFPVKGELDRRQHLVGGSRVDLILNRRFHLGDGPLRGRPRQKRPNHVDLV